MAFDRDVTIDINADISGYTTSLQQALETTKNFARAGDGVLGPLTKLNIATTGLIDITAKWTGVNKLAVAQAAAYQQKLAGIEASTRVTGQRFGELEKTTRSFARNFPVGIDKAVEVVESLQEAGVTTTKDIKNLGEAFVKLGAATGTNAAAMGVQFTQLTKTFGNSLSQVGKLGDSLTYVTKMYGASAGSVVSFAKAIAPVTSVVGMSETQTLGLATAMSKLGEDGYRAANTFNKVLMDISKSIRTGSPEMKTYAALLDTTQSSLEAMFKADPTKVLEQFTQAVKNQGTDAITVLDRMGYEGVSTFKVISALSRENFTKYSQDASKAYGNGSTDKAAATAMGGVNDQFQMLQETMRQTVASAGKPFLGMLTEILKIANSLANAFLKIVDNPITQWFGKMVAAIAPAIASMTTFIGVMSTLAFGKTILGGVKGSSVVQDLIGGFKAGRAGEAGPPASVSVANGAASVAESAAAGAATGGATPGQLMSGMSNSVTELTGGKSSDFAGNLGHAIGVMFGPSSGISEEGNAFGNIKGKASSLGQAIMNLGALNFRSQEAVMDQAMGKEPPLTGAGAAVKTSGRTLIESLKDAMSGGGFAGVKDAGKQFASATGDYLTSTKSLSGAAKNLASSFLSASGTAVKFAGSLASRVGAGLGALGFTPATIGITAAMFAFSQYQNWKGNQNKMRDEAVSGYKDPNSVFNDFAAKAGFASKSISALSDTTKKSTEDLSKGATSMKDALTFTAEDKANIGSGDYESAFKYSKGSAKEVSNNAAMLLGYGASPAEVKRVMMDIAHDRGTDFASKVQQDYASRYSKPYTSFDAMSNGIKDLAHTHTSWTQNLFGGSINQDQADKGKLTSTAITEAADVATKSYGSKGGALVRASAAQQLWDQARETSNQSQAQSLIDQLSALTKISKENLPSAAAISNYGKKGSNTGWADVVGTLSVGGSYGGFSEATEESKSYGQNQLDLINQGYDLSNVDLKNLQGQGSTAEKAARALDYVDNGRKQAGAFNFADLIYGREVVARQSGGIAKDIKTDDKRMSALQQALAQSAENSDLEGKGYGLAVSAGTQLASHVMGKGGAGYAAGTIALMKQVSQLDATDPRRIALVASFGQMDAQNQINVRNSGLKGRTDQAIQMGAAARAMGPLDDKEMEAKRQQLIAGEQNAYQERLDFAKQFVQAKQNLDIQLGRQQEDFNKQSKRSTDDYNLQVLESTQDFNKQRSRSVFDFNRQMTLMQEDFNISQRRQLKAHNKQVTRMQEDAASTMYAPFKRIQFSDVIDTGSILANLQQQTQAIDKQMSNLAAAHKAGLTQQAIDQLGLAKTENAQQLDVIMKQVSADPSLIRQLNASTAMKGAAAAKLSTSNDQVDYRRGQQDFKESMDYAQQDYDRSVKRSETAFKLSLTRMDADFKTQMGRAEKHFKTSMTRMGEDFKVSTNRAYEDLSRFGQEVSGTSTEIQQKYLNAVADLPSAAKKTMSKNVKDMVSEMKTSFSSTFDQNFKQFGISASDLSAANPATVNMNLSPANSMTLPTDDTITLNSDYKIVDKGSSKKSGNYVIVNLGAYDYVYTGLDASSVTKLAKGATGKAGTSIGTTVKYTNVYTPQMLSGAHGTSFALADGGIVTRQINAVVGEAGYPEAVIPLNDRGANMLADAMARYVNGTDAQMSRVTPYSTSIDNSSTSHVYDNKTVFSGPVSVVAQDPNEMARKLTVRTRRDRMVQTVGSR